MRNSSKDENFKIFIEQLRSGNTEQISLSCSPDFLAINEDELHFVHDVTVEGEAYSTDEELVLRLNVEAHAVIPCSICNAPVEVVIEMKNFYHAESLEPIKEGFFNYQEILREAILLEVPPFAECKQGNCPQRQQISKYLKEPKPSDGEWHQPFADINLDQFKP